MEAAGNTPQMVLLLADCVLTVLCETRPKETTQTSARLFLTTSSQKREQRPGPWAICFAESTFAPLSWQVRSCYLLL